MSEEDEKRSRGILGDLKDPRLMYLKGALFLVIGLVSAGALFALDPQWLTALLLILAIWAFCRLYYFFFYVIEKYIDSSYRFAGLYSVVIYLLSRRRTQK